MNGACPEGVRGTQNVSFYMQIFALQVLKRSGTNEQSGKRAFFCCFLNIEFAYKVAAGLYLPHSFSPLTARP